MISENQYKILGRLVMNKLPFYAKELLSPYLNNIPQEIDHSKIPGYFTLFCKVMDLKEDEYTGPLQKSSKVDMRRIFIAAMIHLYQPVLYHQKDFFVILRKTGFMLTLAQTLHQFESNISNTIREVILWEREYDDFKEKVNSAIEKLAQVEV